MKIRFLTCLLAALFLICSAGAFAQGKKAKPAVHGSYPASFTISKAEFDNLFAYKLHDKISAAHNPFINKAELMVSSVSGDMKFLKLKLYFFLNSFLLVQVNGVYSTQVFIMSSDKKVFYKGQPDKGNVLMSKCSEDDIVSE